MHLMDAVILMPTGIIAYANPIYNMFSLFFFSHKPHQPPELIFLCLPAFLLFRALIPYLLHGNQVCKFAERQAHRHIIGKPNPQPIPEKPPIRQFVRVVCAFFPCSVSTSISRRHPSEMVSMICAFISSISSTLHKS